MRSAVLLASLIAAAAALPTVKRQGDDLNSILADLQANDPEEAAAAEAALNGQASPNDKRGDAADDIITALTGSKKRDEVDDAIAALRANNPEDAAAAESGEQPDMPGMPMVDDTACDAGDTKACNDYDKRDEVDDVITALKENNPEDAAAAENDEEADTPDKKKRDEDACDRGDVANCNDFD